MGLGAAACLRLFFVVVVHTGLQAPKVQGFHFCFQTEASSSGNFLKLWNVNHGASLSSPGRSWDLGVFTHSTLNLRDSGSGAGKCTIANQTKPWLSITFNLGALCFLRQKSRQKPVPQAASRKVKMLDIGSSSSLPSPGRS